MQNASIVACATKEENDLKVARAFRRRREKNAKYLMRENCLRCDLCAIEPMSMNSARAGIPCAARRRPLEAMAELEKFPSVSTVCVDPIWVGPVRVGPVWTMQLAR
jgi:hypothetical protein